MNEHNDNINLREEKKRNYWLWIILGLVALIILASIFGLFNRKEVKTIQDQKNSQVDLIGGIEGSLVKVDNLNIKTLESFPVQTIITVGGVFPNTCTIVSDISQFLDGDIFYIILKSGKKEVVVCEDIETPYEEVIALEVIGLNAGTYTVDVNGVQTKFEINEDNIINWEAGEDK